MDSGEVELGTYRVDKGLEIHLTDDGVVLRDLVKASIGKDKQERTVRAKTKLLESYLREHKCIVSAAKVAAFWGQVVRTCSLSAAENFLQDEETGFLAKHEHESKAEFLAEHWRALLQRHAGLQALKSSQTAPAATTAASSTPSRKAAPPPITALPAPTAQDQTVPSSVPPPTTQLGDTPSTRPNPDASDSQEPCAPPAGRTSAKHGRGDDSAQGAPEPAVKRLCTGIGAVADALQVGGVGSTGFEVGAAGVVSPKLRRRTRSKGSPGQSEEGEGGSGSRKSSLGGAAGGEAGAGDGSRAGAFVFGADKQTPSPRGQAAGQTAAVEGDEKRGMGTERLAEGLCRQEVLRTEGTLHSKNVPRRRSRDGVKPRVTEAKRKLKGAPSAGGLPTKAGSDEKRKLPARVKGALRGNGRRLPLAETNALSVHADSKGSPFRSAASTSSSSSHSSLRLSNKALHLEERGGKENVLERLQAGATGDWGDVGESLPRGAKAERQERVGAGAQEAQGEANSGQRGLFAGVQERGSFEPPEEVQRRTEQGRIGGPEKLARRASARARVKPHHSGGKEGIPRTEPGEARDHHSTGVKKLGGQPDESGSGQHRGRMVWVKKEAGRLDGARWAVKIGQIARELESARSDEGKKKKFEHVKRRVFDYGQPRKEIVEHQVQALVKKDAQQAGRGSGWPVEKEALERERSLQTDEETENEPAGGTAAELGKDKETVLLGRGLAKEVTQEAGQARVVFTGHMRQAGSLSVQAPDAFPEEDGEGGGRVPADRAGKGDPGVSAQAIDENCGHELVVHGKGDGKQRRREVVGPGVNNVSGGASGSALVSARADDSGRGRELVVRVESGGEQERRVIVGPGVSADAGGEVAGGAVSDGPASSRALVSARSGGALGLPQRRRKADNEELAAATATMLRNATKPDDEALLAVVVDLARMTVHDPLSLGRIVPISPQKDVSAVRRLWNAVFMPVAIMVAEGKPGPFSDLIDELTRNWPAFRTSTSWKAVMPAAAVRMYENNGGGQYKFVPDTPYHVIRQGRHLGLHKNFPKGMRLQGGGQLSQADYLLRQMDVELAELVVNLQPRITRQMCKPGTYDARVELQDDVWQLHECVIDGSVRELVRQLRDETLVDLTFELRHWEL